MKFVALALLLSLCFSHPALGEDHASDSSRGRPVAEWKLRKPILTFLTSHFSMPEEYFLKQYNEKLPQAIDKAIAGDEEPLADLIAKLMGTVNTEQIKKIVSDAEKEIRSDDPDGRFQAFMTRLVWAGKMLTGNQVNNDKTKKFNPAFAKSYNAVKKWNETANEKLKQAADGNEAAKKWVKENINQDAILGYAEGQKKSGKSEAAERVVGALSTKVDGHGNVLDMLEQGEAQRLFLGNDKASLKNTLNAFFEKQGGFKGAKAAAEPHATTPKTAWILKDGKLVDFRLPGTPDDPRPTPTASPTPSGPIFQDQQFDHAKVKGAIGKCMMCHGEDATKPELFSDDLDKSRKAIFKSFGLDPSAPNREAMDKLKSKIFEGSRNPMAKRAHLTPEEILELEKFLGIPHGGTSTPNPHGTPTPSPTPRPTASPSAQSIKLKPFIEGVKSPVAITTAPGEPNRLYLTEQEGRIRVIENGRLLDEPFLDIKSRVRFGGERGLLSVAFHPEYNNPQSPNFGRYFVNYTADRPDLKTIIAEYRKGSNQEKVLLEIKQPFANHNGGQLQFGPDGLLYIGMGDGGDGGDPQGHGQNQQSLLGKMLTLDVSKSNPKPEIFASGLRNPWRFSFDRKTGELYAADVGQNAWEEIDIIKKGENYGWNKMEGNHCFPEGSDCDQTGFTPPIFEYAQGDNGRSVTGGYVYRGTKIPWLQGSYVYGDFVSGKVWALKKKADGTYENKELLSTSHQISSFGETSDGELLLIDYSGKVLEIK